jgi:hypothetical protein
MLLVAAKFVQRDVALLGCLVDDSGVALGEGTPHRILARETHREALGEERTESERFRYFTFEELIARDKASMDIFWLRDDSLADSDNLPPPEVIAQEIVEDLEAALEQFRLIAGDLNSVASGGGT